MENQKLPLFKRGDVDATIGVFFARCLAYNVLKSNSKNAVIPMEDTIFPNTIS